MNVVLRRVLPVVFGAAVLWFALGAWQALSAAADLRQAQEDATAGRERAGDGDMGAARRDLAEAADAFDAAHRRLAGPAVLPWRAIPPARRNLDVVTHLAAAGARTARAGERLTAAVDELPGGVSGLAPRDGALPLAALRELAQPLRDAAGLLAAARRDLERTDGVPVVDPVARARTALADVVGPGAEATQRAASLAPVLPSLLGAGEPRSYLFVAQNPAELRGTGGFIGAFSVVTFDDGAISFREFGEIHELPAYHASQVTPPSEDYARRYNRYGGAGFWHNINMTPDFPTAARAMQNLYEKGTGADLDGVIAADPFAFEALLAVAGDMRVRGFGRVHSGNVVDVVSNLAHARLADSAARKRLLGAVAVRAFEGLLRSGENPLETTTALAAAAVDGHLLVRSDDPQTQAALLQTDLAGALPSDDGDFLAVVANAGSAAKLDYYIDRAVRYEVALEPDGSLRARATVTFANSAPRRGISRRVIGPNADGLEAGEQRLIVGLYTAPGTRAGAFVRSSGDRPIEIGHELGRPVYSTVVEVPSRSTEQLALSWERSEAWEADAAGGGRYRLTVHNQPTLRPTTLEVVVRLPPDTVVEDLPDGVEQLADGTLRFRTADAGDLALDVELASTRRPGLWTRISDWLSRPLIQF